MVKPQKTVVKKITQDDTTVKASNLSKNEDISEKNLIVVGIGASAGGLEALKLLLPGLPVNAGMSFIIAQHLGPKHRSMLASLLERHTEMPILEVTDKETIEPNRIYITPPGKDITLHEGKVVLSKPLAAIGPKPSVDFFFTSLAEEKKDRAVGIILSGTGSDGAHGIRAIKAEGGITIVQASLTAKYDGMPHSAINTGHVDIILPPEDIGSELESLVKYPRQLPKIPLNEAIPSAIDYIFSMINDNIGADFSNYKKSTINRRVGRRMALHKISDINVYVDFIKREKKELHLLFKDILISVTKFFRDLEAFQNLQEVLIKILENKKPGDSIRIWTPGCATGEETFSIAIVLCEILGNSINKYNIQIFGTDLDNNAIDIARRGTYSTSMMADIPENLLDKYFTHDDNSLHIIKTIREMIVFARQDLTKDPPFSNLDLVSCRNLLIYFNSSLQKQIIQMFHYVLNSRGILFLGKSETIGQFADLFMHTDKKWKIFQRRDTMRSPMLKIGKFNRLLGLSRRTETVNELKEKKISLSQIFGEAVIDIYKHSAVLVDDRREIVFVHGDTSPFLSLPTGDAGLNILSMVKHPLRTELRSLIHKSMREKKPLTSNNINMTVHGQSISVVLRIGPVHIKGSTNQMTLVIFEQTEPAKPISIETKNDKDQCKNPRIAELEHELAEARDNLQTTVEELETANEELQSMNEELQSANEELHSTNEEMETSNEELQSTNEELTTVNEEFQVKSAELATANADLENILKNVGVAMLIVNQDLKVSRYTPPLKKLFNIKSLDIGQLITSIPSHFTLNNFREILNKAAIFGENTNHDISFKGHFYRLKILPYLDEQKRPFGAMLIFFDCTDLISTENVLKKSEKRSAELDRLNHTLEKEIRDRVHAEKELRHANQLLKKAFDNIHVMIAYMDSDYHYIAVNQAYADGMGQSSEYFIGKSFFDLYPDKDLNAIFDRVKNTKEPHFVLAKPFSMKNIQQHKTRGKIVDITIQPITESENKTTGLLLSIIDVTERVEKLIEKKQQIIEAHSMDG